MITTAELSLIISLGRRMSMADERLAEIEARAQAATEGPWRVQSVRRADNEIGVFVAYVGSLAVLANEPNKSEQEDATFVAHARTDIPDLLAEVRRLRAVLAEIANPDGVSDLNHKADVNKVRHALGLLPVDWEAHTQHDCARAELLLAGDALTTPVQADEIS